MMVTRQTFWGRSAIHEEIVTQKGLYTCQTQVRQTWAVVKEGVNGLLASSENGSVREGIRPSYLKAKAGAVTQVNSLQHCRSNGSVYSYLFGPGERHYAPVRDIAAFHQAYALQLRQRSELRDRVVSQVGAACQIDISNAITRFDELGHSGVGNLGAMAQMNVVQILPEPRYSKHGAIRNMSALGQNQVAQSRSGRYYLHDTAVLYIATVGQI
jgi:hypothetical protein